MVQTSFFLIFQVKQFMQILIHIYNYFFQSITQVNHKNWGFHFFKQTNKSTYRLKLKIPFHSENFVKKILLLLFNSRERKNQKILDVIDIRRYICLTKMQNKIESNSDHIFQEKANRIQQMVLYLRDVAIVTASSMAK